MESALELQNTREVLVNEIVDEVMSRADDMANSCGCGGCAPEPTFP